MNKYIPKKGQFIRAARCVNGVAILFWDKDSVYATDGKTKLLYLRIDGHTRMFYTNHWHKFITYAKHANGLTLSKLNQKAAEHEILITVPRALPIKFFPERSKW